MCSACDVKASPLFPIFVDKVRRSSVLPFFIAVTHRSNVDRSRFGKQRLNNQQTFPFPHNWHKLHAPQPQPFAGVGRGSHLHRCGGGKVFRWEHGRRREGLICLYESEIGLTNHIYTQVKSHAMSTQTHLHQSSIIIVFVLEGDFC